VTKGFGQTVKEGFLQIFQELKNRYDVQLNLSSDREKTGSDLVAIVTPASGKAARIDARLELDFGVYMLVGVQAVLEVPLLRPGYYLELPCLEETRMLCSAVSCGALCENVTYSGGRPFKGSFTLNVPGGKTISQSWRNLYVCPLKRKERRTFVYEAFSQRETASDSTR
jgi:hypothetical protein